MACSPSEPLDLPDIEWEGQWLRFGRSPEVAPQCAGTAPYMDRYVGALAQEFGIELDHKVDFFYVDEMSSPCESLACLRDGRAFSLVPVQEHELVHAVRDFEGLSHHVLEEGTAELWGDDGLYPRRTDTTGSLIAAVEAVTPYDEGLPGEYYSLAGRFAALLADAEASNGYALLRTTSRTTTTSQFDTALRESTGVDLDGWDQMLSAYPACTHAEYRNASAACDSSPLVARCDADNSPIAIEAYVGCDDPLTLGPRDGEIWTYRTFEIERDGTYTFSIGPDLAMQGGRVDLKQCSGGCGSTLQSQPVPSAAMPGPAFDATAGRYVLRFTMPEGTSDDFSVWIGGDCP